MRTTWLLLLFRADSTAKVWLSDVDLTASLASCCELSADCILVSRRNTMKRGVFFGFFFFFFFFLLCFLFVGWRFSLRLSSTTFGVCRVRVYHY